MGGIDSISYLSFFLNREVFSVNVSYVTEVLEISKITKIPKTSSFKRGIVNLRGDVLPVISLRQRFNMPEKEDDKDTVIIVFEIEKLEKYFRIGCVADNIKEVLEIEEDEIQKVPDIASNYDTDLLEGMMKQENHFIKIINCNELFNLG